MYMAPEVVDLQKGKTFDPFKADIYSLGVCLYILLIGELPDKELILGNSLQTNDSDMEDDQQMSKQNEKHSTKKWNCLSETVKNLIIKMLSVSPDSRPSIQDLINHEWLCSDFDSEITNELYSEMIHRKKFIQDYSKRKIHNKINLLN